VDTETVPVCSEGLSRCFFFFALLNSEYLAAVLRDFLAIVFTVLLKMPSQIPAPGFSTTT